MTRRLLRASEVPLTLLMALVAAVSWTRGYADPGLPVLLSVAAVLSTGIPYVCARVLRQPFIFSVVGSVIGFLVFSLGIVLRSPLGFAELARGLGDGAAQLLTNTLPLAGGGAALILPLTLCWLIGALVGELSARTRSVGLPIVAAFVGFGISYAATVGGLGDQNGWAAVLLLDAGALLFVRRWINEHSAETDASEASTRDGAGWRPLVFGSVTLALAALVCLVVVPNIDSLQGRPVTPNRQPPELRSSVVTPVADVAALRRRATPSEDEPGLFDVTFDRPAPGYVAVAHLDDYDGDKWTYDRRYLPTGGRIPGGDGPGLADAVPLDMAVEVHDPLVAEHNWLPTVGRPIEVNGVPVRFDPDTASLVPVEPVRPGTRYQVRTRTPNQVLAAMPTDGSVSFDTSLPAAPVPDALNDHLDAWLRIISKERNAEVHATPEFFRAVEAHLSDPNNYARLEDRVGATTPTTTTPTDPAAPPTSASPASLTGPTGTSFTEVEDALLGESSSGTPEQFATAFAALARRKNIPARVVTGFRITPPDQVDGTVPSGRHTVRASQAWTWVEVAIIGQGWVVVDPTPDSTKAPTKDNVRDDQTTTSTAPAPTTSAVQIIVVGSAPPPSIAPESPPDDRTVLVVLGVVAVPTLIVLALLMLMLLRTRRRAKRRAAPTPTERIIGAWHETLDLLYEADLQDLEACTNTEVATAASGRFGDDVATPVTRVGQFANRAIFDSAGPPADQVEGAWQDVEDLRRAIKGTQSGRERVLTFLRVSPRSVTQPRSEAENRN